MSLRLTSRQVSILAEMGILWPVAPPAPREVVWVALTASAPQPQEAQLLANVLASIEKWLDARTATATLESIPPGVPALLWVQQTFGAQANRQLGLVLFGEDLAERLLGSPAASGRAALPGNCSLVTTRSLADLSSSATDKRGLWRALCEAPSVRL